MISLEEPRGGFWKWWHWCQVNNRQLGHLSHLCSAMGSIFPSYRTRSRDTKRSYSCLHPPDIEPQNRIWPQVCLTVTPGSCFSHWVYTFMEMPCLNCSRKKKTIKKDLQNFIHFNFNSIENWCWTLKIPESQYI